MAHYTARIELNVHTHDAYQMLHRSMEAAGFSPLAINDSAGSRPYATAEFSRDSDQDLDTVFESARQTVAETGMAFSVLITESSSHRWIGVRVCRNAS